MLEPKKRVAHVNGTRLDDPSGNRFEANIEFELHDDCVYYQWRARTSDGTVLASLSQPLSLRVVPANTNAFECALAHAAESINRYRIRRVKAFRVDDVAWE